MEKEKFIKIISKYYEQLQYQIRENNVGLDHANIILKANEQYDSGISNEEIKRRISVFKTRIDTMEMDIFILEEILKENNINIENIKKGKVI